MSAIKKITGDDIEQAHCEVCDSILVQISGDEVICPRCAASELAQLRAAAAELQAAHVYLDESYINGPDTAPLSLADRIAPLVQAYEERDALQEAVNEAREIIKLLPGFRALDIADDYASLVGKECGYTQSLRAYAKALNTWLAAHHATPAPEQGGAQLCKCVCGCSNVATTDDGCGLPMCQGCHDDYYGIPPEQRGKAA